MPELPDVEVMRRYFAETSLHKKVEDVEVLDDYVIKKIPSADFKSCLKGATFEKVDRRGKFLEVKTDSEHDLAIHFGMTGYIRYVTSERKHSRYVRVVFAFQNHDLRYISKRKLGGLYVVKNGNFDSIGTIENMGPEPLDSEFNFDRFKSITKNRSAMTKSLLLDQSFIAGIGNVYADEILFQAGICPSRRISELNERQLHTLFREIKDVLETAIKHGTELQGLEQEFLIPHRGPEGKCPKCGSQLRTTKVSSRTSYWCEHCQS